MAAYEVMGRRPPSRTDAVQSVLLWTALVNHEDNVIDWNERKEEIFHVGDAAVYEIEGELKRGLIKEIRRTGASYTLVVVPLYTFDEVPQDSLADRFNMQMFDRLQNELLIDLGAERVRVPERLVVGRLIVLYEAEYFRVYETPKPVELKDSRHMISIDPCTHVICLEWSQSEQTVDVLTENPLRTLGIRGQAPREVSCPTIIKKFPYAY